EDYINEANVVVPRPNPNFDPSKYDPSKIGVQPGGLKMPPTYKSSRPKLEASKPTKAVNHEFMLGWIARNAKVTINDGSLQITPAGRKPFLATAKLRINSPAQVRIRIRAPKDGRATLQWRTEDQDEFPEVGQRQSFAIKGGDWQELTVPVDVKGRLVHLRLYMSDSKRPTEIDWIEIGPKEGNSIDFKFWDFRVVSNPPDPQKHQ
ncbi:MAG: hypothetical protein AAF483_21450, partial [Planctomycetota bacterium]